MNAPSDKLGHDSLLEEAYDRALRGDQRAGHFLLTLLHNSLRETGGATLTDIGRSILAEMLRKIIDGEDARDVTFTLKGSGDPEWKRQGRYQMLVSEMNWRIKQGMSNRAAAIDVAKKEYFKKDNGDPIKWKTINNIWLERKDDPDLAVVFFKDED
jgi:hypothetical protein